ncbi:HEPN domain-containing protein [Streptomyces sp. SL13]|uniref:HEPN domain-containing protein n=1 Tax=Streptantibioticus silvisoli TaxID=2705255 RepID=A0AA90H1Y4_9ACTN|nr:HEPN domain-containing protein [Streptantibioticus silvisoli]MDI5971874.1 HEPN domain-containing protein [Streptantibioticus silvisoli]
MDFLRYVLNLRVSEPVEDGFDRGEVGVNETIFQLALASRTSENNLDVYLKTVQFLTSRSDESSTSIVNDLRLRNGGEIPEVPSIADDEFLASLVIVARDIWAAYLVVPPPSVTGNAFFAAAPVGLVQHPVFKELCLNFLKDVALSKLFPDISQESSPEEIAAHMAMWFATAGANGTKSPISVLSGLLFDASVRMRFFSTDRAFDAYLVALKSCVRDLRLLAQGATVHVPAIVGFSGISFSGELELQLDGGKIRPPRPIEKELLLASGGSITAVFETTFPLRIIHITKNGPAQLSDDAARKAHNCILATYKEFEQSLNKMRLGLLLSSDGKEFLASLEHSRFIFDLTNMGGQSGVQMVGNTLLPRALSAGSAVQVERIHRAICSNHPDSLDIAMQRVLRAASARGDDSDGLIDALISWENMFGASTETTFRVTASLAKLIESDSGRRREKRKELAKIYSSRSKIVHGAKEIPGETVYEQRQDAILVACQALRVLYTSRTDLLGLKSEDRGTWLLLEGAPPSVDKIDDGPGGS